jgi:aspartyl protease family protein
LWTGFAFGAETPNYEFLKEKGLKASAGFYVLSEETDVSKGLSDVKSLERALNVAVRANKQLEAEIENAKATVERLLAENKRMRPEYDRAFAAKNYDVSNRLVNRLNANTEEINRLQTIVNDDNYGKEIRSKYSKAREDYMNKLLGIRAALERGKEKYAELAKLEGIAKKVEHANRELEKEYELGPSKLFERNEQALAKLESKIMSETLQLRKVSNTYEIDVVLNGKLTKAMVFDTGASAVSLPASVAAELGLKTGEDDVKVRVSIANGEIVIATRKSLDSVRVGKFEAKNVECLIMPPELREAPMLLGGSFINQFTYKMDTTTGKLTLGRIDDGGSDAPTKSTKSKTKSKKPGKSK